MHKVYHAIDQYATQLSLFTLSKVCPYCQQEKILDDFVPDRKMPNGRKSKCKQCHNEYNRKQRTHQLPKTRPCIDCQIAIPTHKKRCDSCNERYSKEYSHAHYMANREKRTAQIRAYHEEHREWYLEYQRRHNKEYRQRPETRARRRELNRTEKHRAYNRAYQHRTRAGNPKWQEYDRKRNQKPERKAQRHAYNHMRHLNPQFRAYKKAYNLAHPEQAKAQSEKKRIKYATNPQYRQKQRADGTAWRKAYPLKAAEQSRRRHARQRGTTVGKVSYSAILRRDGYWCHICEQMILPEQKLQFDHVIPLARKGTHTEKNIKPSHAVCNTRKNGRLLSEMTPFDRRGPD